MSCFDLVLYSDSKLLHGVGGVFVWPSEWPDRGNFNPLAQDRATISLETASWESIVNDHDGHLNAMSCSIEQDVPVIERTANSSNTNANVGLSTSSPI